MLTRDQILSITVGRPTEEVDAPELGGSVHVRTMTAGERDTFDQENSENGLYKDFRARLVILTASDPAGAPLFTDRDIAALSALPVTALDPIVSAAMRRNGLTSTATETDRKN